MSTRRRIIQRGPSKNRLPPPEAVAAFRELIRLDDACTCAPYEYESYQEKCPACAAWWREYMKLHVALDMPIWEWPCIHRPDRHWHPRRTPPWRLAQKWVPDAAKLERFRMLERAAAETAA